MTKKSLLLMLSLVLALTIGLGSTLAYLTDTDAEVNTFTIGDVDIELDEEYEQDQPINPGVEVDKVVKIKNVSENEAWVWYTVAIPVAGEGEDAKEVIVPTYNNDPKWTAYGDPQALKIEGELYNVYTYLWNEELAGGAETAEGLQKIQMHPSIDYDPVSGTYKFIEKGEEVGSIDYDLTAGKVYVNAYAIQTEGFDTVEEAYVGFMGQWTEDGENYTEDMILAGSAPTGTPVETVDDLLATLEAGELNDIYYSGSDDVVIDETFSLENPVKIDLGSAKLVFEDGGKLVLGNGSDVTLVNAEIEVGDSKEIFEVAGGSTLTLGEGTTLENYDAEMENSGLIRVYGDSNGTGKLVLDGAKIANNDNNGKGSLIVVSGDAEMVIEKNTVISGNTFTGGTSGDPNCLFDVYNATVTMNGGTIKENSFGWYTLINLEYNAKFVMNGGSIVDNEYAGSKSAPAIFRLTGSAKGFEMNGGSISNNKLSGSYGALANSMVSGKDIIVFNGGTVNGNTAQYLGYAKTDNVTIGTGATIDNQTVYTW